MIDGSQEPVFQKVPLLRNGTFFFALPFYYRSVSPDSGLIPFFEKSFSVLQGCLQLHYCRILRPVPLQRSI